MIDQAGKPSVAQTTPVFTIISAVFAVIGLFSPLLLITIPIMVSVGLAIVGLIRKERPRWVAAITIAVCVLLLFASSKQLSSISGTGEENLQAAEIKDWSWDADPSFGSQGTIKWRVSIQNKTDKPIASVKVDFTSYDTSEIELKNVRISEVSRIFTAVIREQAPKIYHQTGGHFLKTCF